jgi:hypothetical protein
LQCLLWGCKNEVAYGVATGFLMIVKAFLLKEFPHTQIPLSRLAGSDLIFANVHVLLVVLVFVESVEV